MIHTRKTLVKIQPFFQLEFSFVFPNAIHLYNVDYVENSERIPSQENLTGKVLQTFCFSYVKLLSVIKGNISRTSISQNESTYYLKWDCFAPFYKIDTKVWFRKRLIVGSLRL